MEVENEQIRISRAIDEVCERGGLVRLACEKRARGTVGKRAVRSRDRRLEKLRRDGLLPVRVPVYVEGYLQWCTEEDKILDELSRSLYAAELLHRMERNE